MGVVGEGGTDRPAEGVGVAFERENDFVVGDGMGEACWDDDGIIGEGRGRIEDGWAEVDVDGEESEGVDGDVRAARDRDVDVLEGDIGDVGEGKEASLAFAPEVEVIRASFLASVPPPLAAPDGD